MGKPGRKPGTDQHAKTSAKRVEIAEHKARILSLRKRGLTLDQIGKEIGHGAPYVHRLLTEAIREIPTEDAPEVKAMELRRLDSIHSRWWSRLEDSDELGIPIDSATLEQATRSLLRIAERRAKILGLDAPTKIEATVTDPAQIEADVIALYKQQPILWARIKAAVDG